MLCSRICCAMTSIEELIDDLFGARADLARAYHDSLATDGLTRGFMGPREKDRLWDRHILPCALTQSLYREGASVVDVGSGAGLPGIPLAIARPDLEVTLLEPLLKRSNYLREVVDKLGLDNVWVARGRAEDKPVGKQDYATSRAVAPLAKLAKWSLPLVRKDGGEVLAMKGDSAAEEIVRDRGKIKGTQKPEIVTLENEALSHPTIIVRLVRVA